MTAPDTPADLAETERACTCTPLPSCEGPCAWCDVHGLPSVAWEQAITSTWRQANELWRNDRDQLRADRDRYSSALRVMAARLTRERREATYWASGDWQVENRRLRADLAAARTAQESALDTAQQAAEALVDQGQVMERMSAEMRRMDAENAELRADRDRWKHLAEGWYREHNKALDDRDAARATPRSQAKRADTPAAGEVREEWGWVHPQDEDTAVMGGYSEEVARERAVRDAGTLYRRTVTTSPWVEVPDVD